MDRHTRIRLLQKQAEELSSMTEHERMLLVQRRKASSNTYKLQPKGKSVGVKLSKLLGE